MTNITLTNVTLGSRRNQNTTITIRDREYGFKPEFLPDEKWLLDNMKLYCSFKKQKDTKVKINWQS